MKHLILILACLATMACTTKRETLCGGYSDPVRPTDEQLELFAKCYNDSIALTPKKVATQVVAGLNYSFTCKGDDGKYEVVIYQPLPGQGEARVTSVTKL